MTWVSLAIALLMPLRLLSQSRQIANEPSAEVEFAALERLSAPRVLGADEKIGSTELAEESRARSARIHERGMAFLERFPTDPRRWEVVVMMRAGPNFSREVEVGGVRKVERDVDREGAWRTRFRELLDQLLVAPDASPKAVTGALNHLISAESMNLRDGFGRNHAERMAQVLNWLERYERTTTDTWSLAYLYLTVSRALNRLDAQRCMAFLLGKKAMHPGADRASVHIREMLDGRIRAMLAEAEPMWLQLRSIDGRFTDITAYRGKVVLIAMFTVTWKENADFLEKLYRDYHADGLEVIQISSSDNRENYGQPLDARDMAKIVIERRWAWPVVWDPRGTMGLFARTLGITGQPSWLLLSRDGRLIAERVIRAQIEETIKAELARPVPTVK
jgi:hypothetical protein